GGRLSRPKAWRPGALEAIGLEGLRRHHLHDMPEQALLALHSRIHELDAKAPKDMRPTLEVAHARIAEALGSRHTLVHDLDFSGRSPHDLEDLTQADYCKDQDDACLHEVHRRLHQAWTQTAGAYHMTAP